MSENSIDFVKEIRKKLTANDVGLTGGHQAGILIPKNKDILSFFPSLTADTLNPKIRLLFQETHGERWFFNFIYYNNRNFGGTRNEYRLTCMTGFIRGNSLKTGDEIVFRMNAEKDRFISYHRANTMYTIDNGVMIMHGDWKIVN